MHGASFGRCSMQGHLVHKKTPTPYGPLQARGEAREAKVDFRALLDVLSNNEVHNYEGYVTKFALHKALKLIA